MSTDLTKRAQRLIDEFNDSVVMDPGALDPGESVRHGIAAVLRFMAHAYACDEGWITAPNALLCNLAAELEAATLLDRALAGDRDAARQFLFEGGFTDSNGKLLPHFQTPQP